MPIRRPGDLRKVLRGIYAGLDDDQDHVLLLILNIGNEITGFKVVASGAQDHMAVDLRIIFRHALLLGAARIIIVHNHPSGTTRPSRGSIARGPRS